MGKYSVFSSIIAVVFGVLLIVVLQTYTEKASLEIETIRLQRAVNVATDAGMDAVFQNSENLDLFNLSVDPVKLSDRFFKSLLVSYAMSYSEENLTLLYSYVPLMTLIMDDGMYVGQGVYDRNNKNYDFHWTEKLPYTAYKVHDAGAGTNYVYNLTLSNTNVRRYLIPGNTFQDELVYSPAAEASQVITSRIINNVAMYMNKANAGARDYSQQFYVPPEFVAEYSTMSISGPTLLVFLQNVDIFTNKPIEAYGIGGTQLRYARKIVGFTISGKKYYCYHDQVPVANANIIEVTFENMYEADEAGYEVYLTWFK